MYQEVEITGPLEGCLPPHPSVKCFTGRDSVLKGRGELCSSSKKNLTMPDNFPKPWRACWGPTGVVDRDGRTLLHLLTVCSLGKMYTTNNGDYPRR